MEKKDLEQIETIFDKSFTKVWKGNIEPALDAMQAHINQLPTKSYLDDKLADLEGG